MPGASSVVGTGDRRAPNLKLPLPLPPQGVQAAQTPSPQPLGVSREYEASSRDRGPAHRRGWTQDEGLENLAEVWSVGPKGVDSSHGDSLLTSPSGGGASGSRQAPVPAKDDGDGDSLLSPQAQQGGSKISLRGPRVWGREWPDVPAELPSWDTPDHTPRTDKDSEPGAFAPANASGSTSAAGMDLSGDAAGGAVSSTDAALSSTIIGKMVDIEGAKEAGITLVNLEALGENVQNWGERWQQPEKQVLSIPPPADDAIYPTVGEPCSPAQADSDQNPNRGWDEYDDHVVGDPKLHAADVDGAVFHAHMAHSSPSRPEPLELPSERDVEAPEESGLKDTRVNISIDSSIVPSKPLQKRRRCRPRCCYCCCCKPTFRGFPCCMIHCPILFAGIVSLLVPALLGAFWPGIEIDSGFGNFMQADSRANEVRVAFLSAISYRTKDGGRRLTPVQAVAPPAAQDEFASPSELLTGDEAEDRNERLFRRTLDANQPILDPQILHKIVSVKFMYRPKEGGSMITPRCLGAMRAFELSLRSLPGWLKVCGELSNPTLRSSCEPGISLANIVWPEDVSSEETSSTPRHHLDTLQYQLNGKGIEPLPLGAAMVLLGTDPSVSKMVLPKDYTSDGEPELIRSVFEFNLICCSMMDSKSEQSSQLAAVTKDYTNFVTEELYPAIRKFADSNDVIDVFFAGDYITGHEVWVTILEDSSKALGSIVFILCYLTLHTKSLVLSLGALLLCVTAIPTAFVVSAIISGNNRVTGASFLSLFLIVGLGADVVLVFISFWELSKEHYEKDRYAARIRYMYKNAGISCLATSMTTAASFFANLASVLRPLREFGFFMGLCIAGAYLLILALFPAVLIIDEKVTACIKRCLGCGFDGEFDRQLTGCGESDSSEEFSDEECAPVDDDFFNAKRSASKTSDTRRTSKNSAASSVNTGSSSVNTGSPSNGRYRLCLDMYIQGFLVPYKWPVFMASMGVPLLAAYWTAMEATVDSGVPMMFPAGHNLNDGKKIVGEFPEAWSIWPAVGVSFCTVGPEVKQVQCDLNWCQIGIGDTASGNGRNSRNGSATCSCRRTAIEDACQPVKNMSNGLGQSLLESRFIGAEYVPDAFWESETWYNHVKKILQQANGDDLVFDGGGHAIGMWRNLSALVQENWETGMAALVPYLRAPTMLFDVKTGNGNICRASQVCYCGVASCRLTGESLTSRSGATHTIEIPAGQRPITSAQSQPQSFQRRASALPAFQQWPPSVISGPKLDSGRRLASSFVDVALVFGLKVRPGSNLLGVPSEDTWSFDPDFRADAPSVQRQLMRACTEAADDPAMIIVNENCWIKEFRTHLRAKGDLFPVRSTRFPTLMLEFAATALLPNGVSVQDQLWFDGNGQVQATFISLDVGLSYDSTRATTIMAYQELWDDYATELNNDAPAGATGSWHTSRLWIRAEAEQAIIGSTMMTMMVSAGCGFLGALSFTQGDLALALMVVFCVLGVTIMLAFWMTVVMGWGYGAVEVLGLIVFVGYSITYSLHIAHKYRQFARSESVAGFNNSEKRERSTHHALKMMTSAVLGSAVTTLGSSVFLLFCTMRIFVKLAVVLFAVTFFAAVFAVLCLPSALLCVGPLGMCGGGGPISERLNRSSGEKAQSQKLLGGDASKVNIKVCDVPSAPQQPSSPGSSPTWCRDSSVGGSRHEKDNQHRGRAGSESSIATSRTSPRNRPKSEVFISAMEATTAHHMGRNGATLPGGAPGVRARHLVVNGNTSGLMPQQDSSISSSSQSASPPKAPVCGRFVAPVGGVVDGLLLPPQPPGTGHLASKAKGIKTSI